MSAPSALLERKRGADYSRARLRLGIVYVGAMVSASAILLATGYPAAVAGDAPEPGLTGLTRIVFWIALFELATLPFDFAGYSIDRRYGKNQLTPLAYLGKWSRAATLHGLVLALIAASLLGALKLGGIPVLVVVSLMASLFLIWGQAPLAGVVSGLKFKSTGEKRSGPTAMITCESSDPGFTGGIVGLPGKEVVVFPRSWMEAFTDRELSAELIRRDCTISSGSRTRGVALAVLFNVVGLTLSARVSEVLLPSIECSAGVLSVSLIFSLWSFAGLILLPRLSHRGVFAADRMALEQGVSRASLIASIERVNDCLEGDHARGAARDIIFHPVPAPARRFERLDQPAVTGKESWNCARYAVYLSIAGLGLLGRVVHCNAGRPDLWVMLPCD